MFIIVPVKQINMNQKYLDKMKFEKKNQLFTRAKWAIREHTHVIHDICHHYIDLRFLSI